jgi:hypothetical protein
VLVFSVSTLYILVLLSVDHPSTSIEASSDTRPTSCTSEPLIDSVAKPHIGYYNCYITQLEAL